MQWRLASGVLIRHHATVATVQRMNSDASGCGSANKSLELHSRTQHAKDALNSLISVVRIQSTFRGHLARKEAVRAVNAAMHLQKVFRGKSSRSNVFDLGLAKRAAVRVQSVFRGKTSRGSFDLHQVREAAVCVQSAFRGLEARRRIKDLLAARTVQELFKWVALWGSPTRGALSTNSVEVRSPPDANRWERLRDATLAFMARHVVQFLTLTVVFGAGLVGFLIFIVILFFPINFGTDMGSMTEIIDARCNLSQYNESFILAEGDSVLPPRVLGLQNYTARDNYVAQYCSNAQRWFNLSIKYLSFYFGFVNGLPIPWTFSIWMHAYHPRRKAKGKKGVDFYGRPTHSLWFHLPLRVRKVVASTLLFALILQIPDCICHAFFFVGYVDIQTWPGILVTNVWLIVQVSCQIYASVIQAKAEAAERRARPDAYPPTLFDYLKKAFRRWRVSHEEQVARGCCGRPGLHIFECGLTCGAVRTVIRMPCVYGSRHAQR